MSDLRAHLEAAAGAGPDPDGARTRIARFCDAAGDELPRLLGDGAPAAGAAADPRPADARALLLALASQSPYLTAPLIREPARLRALALDPYLGREKDAATMRAELAAILDAPDGGELAAGLRRYRNAEYLRLGARELGWGAAEEVARELAHLADVTLDAAVTRLSAELGARVGEPRTADGRRCRFVVFGMGKLGGEELNFSSDIDLFYLYETDRGAAGALSLHEFFTRLCERVTRAIGDVGDDGFVLSRRSAPASRGHARPAVQLARRRRALLRVVRPPVGAAGVGQGARGRRRSLARRGGARAARAVRLAAHPRCRRHRRGAPADGAHARRARHRP